MLGTGYQNKKI